MNGKLLSFSRWLDCRNTTFLHRIEFLYWMVIMVIWVIKKDGLRVMRKGKQGLGFAGSAMLRIISPKTDAWDRFNNLNTLTTFFAHRDGNRGAKGLHLRLKIEDLIGVVWLPISNKFVETKVLTGREYGHVLVGLIKAGAKEVIYYRGINGNDSHIGITAKLPSGLFLTSTVARPWGKTFSLSNLEERVANRKYWWPGTERGLTIEEIEKLCRDQRIPDFSTILINAQCNPDTILSN